MSELRYSLGKALPVGDRVLATPPYEGMNVNLWLKALQIVASRGQKLVLPATILCVYRGLKIKYK